VPDANAVLNRLRVVLGCENDTDLAAALETVKTTVSSWRTRNSVPYEVCMKVHREKGVDLAFLMFGEGEPFPKAINAEVSEAPPPLIGRGALYEEIKQLEIRRPPGGGPPVIDSEPVGYLAFRRDELQKEGLVASRCAWIKTPGDHMVPDLASGDPILINEDERHIVSGKAYVVRLPDDVIVQYLTWMPDGNVQATSRNPTFQPFVISRTDLESGRVAIIGRVRFDNHRWD
jgi:hypothetical protein